MIHLTRQRREVAIPGLAAAISHYTDAVRFGDLLFISGVAAIDSEGHVVAPDDVMSQANYIFKVLARILEEVGAGFSDILKVTVFLTDVTDRSIINPLRQQYFGASKPASTLIGVNALALPGLRVEIEAVVGLSA